MVNSKKDMSCHGNWISTNCLLTNQAMVKISDLLLDNSVQRSNFSLCLLLSLTLPYTEAVTAFSWEPGGSKFAIIHGESPRISASFYNMEEKGKVTLLSEYYIF